MTRRKKQSVRGSTTGRPIMKLFDVLGQRWTMRILWELRGGRLNFRELRERCDQVSPTVLNQRIKILREMALVDQQSAGYALTPQGEELGSHLISLDVWAQQWAETLES